MLKAFLQVSKLQYDEISAEMKERNEMYENLIMTKLMIMPDNFHGGQKKAAKKT